MNIRTQFTVEYTMGKNLNRATLLRVDEFWNKEPEENRLPQRYTWLHFTDTGDVHRIQFSTPQRNDLIDNRIDFSAEGISYTSREYLHADLIACRTDGVYSPATDTFKMTRTTHDYSYNGKKLLTSETKILPDKDPQEVISAAQKHLAHIPVEDEIHLY